MGVFSFIKKDVGYFRKVWKTESHFNRSIIALAIGGSKPNENSPRRLLSSLSDTAKKERKRQEEKVLTALLVLWLALTVWLIYAENWEGFAVWLMFAMLVTRSIVIIRALNPKETNFSTEIPSTEKNEQEKN